MLNSSSEIQWTVMVSWEAVQSSSRIDGGFGAVRKGGKEGEEGTLSLFWNFSSCHSCFPTQHHVARRFSSSTRCIRWKPSAKTSSGHVVFLLHDLRPVSFYFKISFIIYSGQDVQEPIIRVFLSMK